MITRSIMPTKCSTVRENSKLSHFGKQHRLYVPNRQNKMACEQVHFCDFGEIFVGGTDSVNLRCWRGKVPYPSLYVIMIYF